MNTFLLWHLVAGTAQIRPDAPAVACGESSVSYAQLDELSSRIAAALQQAGAQEGDRIGVFSRKSIEAIIALIGILKAGCAYVPVDVHTPAMRFRYLCDNCRLRITFASRETLGAIAEAAEPESTLRAVISADSTNQGTIPMPSLRMILWKDALESYPEPRPCATTEDDPAYILYTSGSTGKPKGVALSHRNALAFVQMATEHFSIDHNDRLGNFVPLHFDLSVFDLYCAFAAGACVVVAPDTTSVFPAAVARCITRQKVTVLNWVPSAFIQLLTRTRPEDGDFSSVRLLIFSGEQFPAKHLRVLFDRFPNARIFNLYGQTEANSSTYFEVPHAPADDTWRVPMGKPFPGFELFARNEEGRAIRTPGEIGELYVKGPTVALGYWNDPERTSSSFVQDPEQNSFRRTVYRTADRVTLDENGNYLFCGRADHLIKSRGFRIELGEIETALNSHPAIAEAAAVAIPDEFISNRIVAFAVPGVGAVLNPQDVVEYLSKRLQRYMLPETVVVRTSFPHTPTSKIDRTALRDSFLSGDA